MPRKVVAIGLSMAVQLATLTAPLVHVHPDDHASAHHRAHDVHVHFERHAVPARPQDQSAVDYPDASDRAVFVRLFVCVAIDGFDLPATVPAPFELNQPSQGRSLRPLYGCHGHDPPFIRSPRAPPAILS